MTLNGTSVRVVGVLGADFRFPESKDFGGTSGPPYEAEVFVPLALSQREKTTPGEFDYTVLARLTAGTTLPRARAQFAAIESSISNSTQSKYGMTLRVIVEPLQSEIVGSAQTALLLLLAAVGGVLLIVCVNLANLFLARFAARRREAAVRVALGARTARLIGQAITESVVLAVLAGGVGIVISRWGLSGLLGLAPIDLPRLGEITLDARVLAVAIAVTLVTGFAFGIVPSVRFGRVDPADVLKGGGRTATSGRGARQTRQILIASQVGLCTLLLVATGLFLASFVRVLRVDKGFVTEPVLAMEVELPQNGYADVVRRAAFFDESLRRLAAMPGATGAAMTSRLPLGGEAQVDFLALEHDARPDGERPSANIRYVSPSYFSTLGISARRGRVFSDADRGRNVVVLSERAARALWPAEDPVGRRMVPGSNDSVAVVVGVVPDVRTSSMEKEGSPVAYLPYFQDAPPTATLLIRAATDPTALTASARQVLRDVAPSVPVGRVRTLAQVVSASVAQRRFQLLLLVLFAVTALATAGVGIYGIMSHSLAQRATEIGIRMALGAGAGDVRRLALVEGLAPAGFGLCVGILMSLVLGRTFSALLFGVGAGDPGTLFGVAGVVALLAALATYVPARRAAKADPMDALRAE